MEKKQFDISLVNGGPTSIMPDLAGIYDAGDFDEVVWTLIGADTVSPTVQLTGTALLLPVSVLTEVGVSPVVTVVSSTVRPRSPPRI